MSQLMNNPNNESNDISYIRGKNDIIKLMEFYANNTYKTLCSLFENYDGENFISIANFISFIKSHDSDEIIAIVNNYIQSKNQERIIESIDKLIEEGISIWEIELALDYRKWEIEFALEYRKNTILEEIKSKKGFMRGQEDESNK